MGVIIRKNFRILATLLLIILVSGFFVIWQRVSADILGVGDSYGGGVIGYILQPGDPGYNPDLVQGLVVSAGSIDATWGCSGVENSGADGTAIGTGSQNTTEIVTECLTEGIAAKVAFDLVEGGFDDWYLPSQDELNKLYLNKDIIGSFESDGYWSSSEFDSTQAWGQNFADGVQVPPVPKGSSMNVRAVRSFSVSSSAPSSVRAFYGDDDYIAISWEDNATSEDGYRIERQTDDGSWDVLTEAAADVENWVDKSGEANHKYVYRVTALEGENESEAVSSDQVYTTPAVPTGLTVASTGQTENTISWTDNANYESGYVIWRRDVQNDGDWEFLSLEPEDTTSYVDVYFDEDTTYDYYVFSIYEDRRSVLENAETSSENVSGYVLGNTAGLDWGKDVYWAWGQSREFIEDAAGGKHVFLFVDYDLLLGLNYFNYYYQAPGDNSWSMRPLDLCQGGTCSVSKFKVKIDETTGRPIMMYLQKDGPVSPGGGYGSPRLAVLDETGTWITDSLDWESFNDPIDASDFDFQYDNAGRLHVVYAISAEVDYFFHTIYEEGAWSEPVSVANTSDGACSYLGLKLEEKNNGNLIFAYTDYNDLSPAMYTAEFNGADWTVENIPFSTRAGCYYAQGRGGFLVYDEHNDALHYVFMSNNGEAVHLLNTDGTWVTEAFELIAASTIFDVRDDGNGNLYVLYDGIGSLAVLRWSDMGGWEDPLIVGDGTISYVPRLSFINGALMVFTDDSNEHPVYYLAGENFSTSYNLATRISQTSLSHIGVASGNNDALYQAWSMSMHDYDEDVYKRYLLASFYVDDTWYVDALDLEFPFGESSEYINYDYPKIVQQCADGSYDPDSLNVFAGGTKADGNGTILYYEYGEGVAKHVVTLGGMSGEFMDYDVKLDIDCLPVVVWGAEYNLKLSKFNGLTWDEYTLDSTVGKILGVGLDIDSSGHYHVAYREALGESIINGTDFYLYGRAIDDWDERVAMDNSQSWGHEADNNVSLETDSSDQPYVKIGNRIYYLGGSGWTYYTMGLDFDEDLLLMDGEGKMYLFAADKLGVSFDHETNEYFPFPSAISAALDSGGQLILGESGTPYLMFYVKNAVPDMPGPCAAQNVTGSSLELVWNDKAYNEDNFLVYQEVCEEENSELIATLAEDTENAEVSSLEGGTAYCFQIVAVNEVGTSAACRVETATIAGTPGTPLNLTPAQMADDLDLTPEFTFYSEFPDGEGEGIYYQLQIYNDPNLRTAILSFDQRKDSLGWSQSTPYEASEVASFELPEKYSLSTGTRYYWRVRAISESSNFSDFSPGNVYFETASSSVVENENLSWIDNLHSYDFEGDTGDSTAKVRAGEASIPANFSLGDAQEIYSGMINFGPGSSGTKVVPFNLESFEEELPAQDFIVLADAPNYAQLFINNDNDGFTLGETFGWDSNDIEVGDFNADGFQDVLMVGAGAYISYQNEFGSFSGEEVLGDSQIETMERAEVGDYDSDGCLDIFVAGSDSVELFQGACDGEFTLIGSDFISMGGQIADIALADFNNDNYLDLLILDWAEASVQSIIYYNQQGLAWTSTVIDDQMLLGDRINLGDVDNDGDIDVVTSNKIFFNLGNSFEVDEGNLTSNICNHGIALSDLDADGDLDLLCADDGDSGLMFNDGWGNFSAKNLFFSGVVQAFISYDANADGTNDVIEILENEVNLCPNENSLHWQLETDLYVTLGSGDFDKDGYVDTIVADVDSLNLILRINRLWSEGSYIDVILDTVSEEASVSVADLNGDGYDDFILGSKVYINEWLSEGSVSFAEQNLGIERLSELKLADVDLDGDFDAFGWFDIEVDAPRTPVLLINNGAGEFDIHDDVLGSEPFGEDLHGFAVGDMDNDGDMDAIYPRCETENVCEVIIGYNDGSGLNYQLQQLSDYYGYDGGWNKVYVADFDNDGWLDILAPGKLLINDKRGFELGLNINMPDAVDDVVLADLDNNGFVDILYSFGQEQEDAILRNYGNFNFTADSSFLNGIETLGNSYSSYFVVDYDNDNDLDIFLWQQDYQNYPEITDDFFRLEQQQTYAIESSFWDVLDLGLSSSLLVEVPYSYSDDDMVLVASRAGDFFAVQAESEQFFAVPDLGIANVNDFAPLEGGAFFVGDNGTVHSVYCEGDIEIECQVESLCQSGGAPLVSQNLNSIVPANNTLTGAFIVGDEGTALYLDISDPENIICEEVETGVTQDLNYSEAINFNEEIFGVWTVGDDGVAMIHINSFETPYQVTDYGSMDLYGVAVGSLEGGAFWYVVGENGTLIYDDTNDSLEYLDTNVNTTLRAVLTDSETDLIFTVGDSDTVLISEDGGQSFETGYTTGEDVDLLSIKSFNNYVYVSGSDGYFARASEGGDDDNWGRPTGAEILSSLVNVLYDSPDTVKSATLTATAYTPAGTNIDYYLASLVEIDMEDLSLPDLDQDFTSVDYFFQEGDENEKFLLAGTGGTLGVYSDGDGYFDFSATDPLITTDFYTATFLHEGDENIVMGVAGDNGEVYKVECVENVGCTYTQICLNEAQEPLISGTINASTYEEFGGSRSVWSLVGDNGQVLNVFIDDVSEIVSCSVFDSFTEEDLFAISSVLVEGARWSLTAGTNGGFYAGLWNGEGELLEEMTRDYGDMTIYDISAGYDEENVGLYWYLVGSDGTIIYDDYQNNEFIISNGELIAEDIFTISSVGDQNDSSASFVFAGENGIFGFVLGGQVFITGTNNFETILDSDGSPNGFGYGVGVNGAIYKIYIDNDNTNISWEGPVTLGEPWIFENPGHFVMWKAELSTSDGNYSPLLDKIDLSYSTTVPETPGCPPNCPPRINPPSEPYAASPSVLSSSSLAKARKSQKQKRARKLLILLLA